jgi:site-specific recombinase XerD
VHYLTLVPISFPLNPIIAPEKHEMSPSYPTVAQAIEDFLSEPEMDAAVKERTHHTYRTGLHAFMAFLSESRLPPETTTTDSLKVSVLRDFYRWLLTQEPEHAPGERFSALTIHTYVAAVTAFLRYLELRRGDISLLTFEVDRARARLGKLEAHYPPLHLPEQMPRVIVYYDNLPLPEGNTPRIQQQRLNLLRNRAILHVLYSSAGRISEIASLNRRDVEDGYREEAIIVGKGGASRVIYFTPEARVALRAYLRERGNDGVSALFVNHRASSPTRRRRLSVRGIWKVVKEAGMAAGVPEVTPHYFRHYRGSKLLEAGLTLPEVQEVLGHRSIQTTRRIYIHLDKERLKETVFSRSPSPDELLRALEEKEQGTKK